MECDKSTYETREDAAGDMKGLRKRYRHHKYSVYKCLLCGYFHITTTTKRKLRPTRKDKYPIEIPAKAEPKKKRKKKKYFGGSK
jgi:hypothetical protein